MWAGAAGGHGTEMTWAGPLACWRGAMHPHAPRLQHGPCAGQPNHHPTHPTPCSPGGRPQRRHLPPAAAHAGLAAAHRQRHGAVRKKGGGAGGRRACLVCAVPWLGQRSVVAPCWHSHQPSPLVAAAPSPRLPHPLCEPQAAQPAGPPHRVAGGRAACGGADGWVAGGDVAQALCCAVLCCAVLCGCATAARPGSPAPFRRAAVPLVKAADALAGSRCPPGPPPCRLQGARALCPRMRAAGGPCTCSGAGTGRRRMSTCG